jgi:hypothetical protein
MRQLKITKSITNRDSNSIEKYLQEIGKEDLISPEMEVELASGSGWEIRLLWRKWLRQTCGLSFQ